MRPARRFRIIKSEKRPRRGKRGGTANDLRHRLSLSPRKQPESAGANFAAKEAFLKACGTGIGGFALCEIQVLRKESGAPYYALTGQAAAWLEENRITAHLSLSHDGGLAQAFTILEQTGD